MYQSLCDLHGSEMLNPSSAERAKLTLFVYDLSSLFSPSLWTRILHRLRMCVYSNSRNDVPRVAQRYGTIAAHTRRRASVLVVFVAFCVHMNSFASLIRRTPPPTFSDTAMTDRHSDMTIFQLRAHWAHCKKTDFTAKYLASGCQFFYHYFYGRLPVEHF